MMVFFTSMSMLDTFACGVVGSDEEAGFSGDKIGTIRLETVLAV